MNEVGVFLGPVSPRAPESLDLPLGTKMWNHNFRNVSENCQNTEHEKESSDILLKNNRISEQQQKQKKLLVVFVALEYVFKFCFSVNEFPNRRNNQITR